MGNNNLPFKLIRPLAQEILAASDILPPTVAVGVDARNFIDELTQFPAMLAELRASDLNVEVVFLQADEEICSSATAKPVAATLWI